MIISRRGGIRPRLFLERLEDRLAPAASIEVIAGGTGSLDGTFLAKQGVITVDDGSSGGTGAETLSTTALAQAAPGWNISVAARSSIAFDDFGTLNLPTEAGASVSFGTANQGGGAITFGNTTNRLTTAGGAIDFGAGTDLILGELFTPTGDIRASSGLSGPGNLFAQALQTSSGDLFFDASNPGGGSITLAEGDAQVVWGSARGSIQVGLINGKEVVLNSHSGSVAQSDQLGVINPGIYTKLLSVSAFSGISLAVEASSLQARNDGNGDISIVRGSRILQEGSLGITAPGVVNRAPGGKVSISQAPLTIGSGARVQTNDGDITLKADTLTVSPGAFISASGGNITLQAGTKLTIAPTASVVTSPSGVLEFQLVGNQGGIIRFQGWSLSGDYLLVKGSPSNDVFRFSTWTNLPILVLGDGFSTAPTQTASVKAGSGSLTHTLPVGDEVQLDDSALSWGGHYTFGIGFIQRARSNPILLTGIQTVSLIGTTNRDTFRVAGSPAAFTTLNTNGGGDSVSVDATADSSVLVINAHSSSQAPTRVTVNDTGSKSILMFYAGSSGANVLVSGTGPGSGLALNGGSNADEFFLGSAGTLDHLHGQIAIHSSGSEDLLQFADQAAAASHHYSVGASQLTRSDADFVLSYNRLDRLTLQLGDGNDTVSVAGVPSGTCTLNAGNGNDSVALTPATASLYHVQWNFGTGSDTITLGGTPSKITGTIGSTRPGHGTFHKDRWTVVQPFSSSF